MGEPGAPPCSSHHGVIGVCFRAMKRLLLLIPFAVLLAGCGGTSGGTGSPNQGTSARRRASSATR